MEVLVPRADPLVGYFAWAVDLLGDLSEVRVGLQNGYIRDEEVLVRLNDVVREKLHPRISISIGTVENEPPDRARVALAEYATLLAAFIGGIRADRWSLRWIGDFLQGADLNQATTVAGYLRALFPEQASAPGIPAPEEVRYWTTVLRDGAVVLDDQGQVVLSRYRRLAARGGTFEKP